MKHIKLFESWLNDNGINEGAINVFEPGNPWKPEGSMTWTGVTEHLPTYRFPRAEFMSDRGIIIGADFDYDKYIANPAYRSIPLGTWIQKSLPKFLDKNPNYSEMEFDFVEIVPQEGKDKKEAWVKIVDKDGIEFMIPPHLVLDILKGGSVRAKVYPGEKFLVDKMRARIVDFGIINPNTARHNNLEPGSTVVIIKMQDGESRFFTLEEWKKANYMHIDESKEENEDLSSEISEENE
jgi:hypothetical protein